MFEGLLVLDPSFARVTAVWVGDTRPSALLRGAGEPSGVAPYLAGWGYRHPWTLPALAGINSECSICWEGDRGHLPCSEVQTAVSLSCHRTGQSGGGLVMG